MTRPSLFDETAGGAAGLIPLVGPLIAPLAERLSSALREEHHRRTSIAIGAAERASKMTREDLAESLAADPKLMPLYVRVLYAAGMNGSDEVLLAMGKLLGVAADAASRQDTGQVDEAELVMKALQDLGTHHFVLLAALATERSPLEADEDTGGPPYLPEAMKQLFPRLRSEIVDLCLLNLASSGLAGTERLWGGDAYRVTDLGRAVLRAAEVMAAEQ